MKKWTWMTGTVVAAAVAMSAPGCKSDETNGDGDGDLPGDGDGDVNPGSGGVGPGAGGGMSGGAPGTGGDDGSGGDGLGGDGLGGMGGGLNIPDVDCSGCAILYAPLSMANTQTDFEIDFGDGTEIDMSNTIVTVRLQVVTTGNAGGLQVYAKNDDDTDPGYPAEYNGWTNLTDLTGDFVEVTLDLSALDDSGIAFDKAEVRWIGINVNAGGEWDMGVPMWEDTFVFVDSITYSDGATSDATFTSDKEGLAVNEYNMPVANSDVFHQP